MTFCSHSRTLLTIGLPWALLTACGEDPIVSYRTPKEPVAVTAAPAAATGAATTLRWSAPREWHAEAASGLRIASFTAAGAAGATADISVVTFPGGGGDDLANLNRWRGQLQLPPIAATELAAQVEAVAGPAGNWVVTNLTGTVSGKGASGMLGAWLRQPTEVWFVKLTGPADLVQAQASNFRSFLNSFVATEPPAETPHAAAAPNLAPMDTMPVQAQAGVSLAWSSPSRWTDEPGHPMRKGSYALPGGGDVAITAFPGDVGGVLANVNRWRGQAGLSPIEESALAQTTSSFDSGGLHFLIVDAQGGSAPVVAALLPWNGGTWFFKLTGPADVVARAKPEFLAFLHTVRAP